MNHIQLRFLIFFTVVALFGCNKKKELKDVDFRFEMVKFIRDMSDYAKLQNSSFLIIPQNGESLVDETGYLDFIDGIGKEDLSYGYDKDGEATESSVRTEISTYLNKYIENDKIVLVTDYVFSNSEDFPGYDAETNDKIDKAYAYSKSKGYIPYATVRNLNYLTINPTHEPSIDTINNVFDVKSFLYYLQPADDSDKDAFISSISETDFDLVIMDFSIDGINEFTAEDIKKIKNGLNHGNGGYVIAYMSIGEAEDYRYYWNDSWVKSNGKTTKDAPVWLYKENPDWEGNYKVLYWKDEWKQIIYGSQNAYLDKIISAGYDGVYLDIVDAYEYYEDVMGI